MTGGEILFLILFTVSLLIYFIPSFVAAFREHHNAVPILLLNIFLGWTFIGWVWALVWSAMGVKGGSTPARKDSQKKATPKKQKEENSPAKQEKEEEPPAKQEKQEKEEEPPAKQEKEEEPTAKEEKQEKQEESPVKEEKREENPSIEVKEGKVEEKDSPGIKKKEIGAVGKTLKVNKDKSLRDEDDWDAKFF